MYAENLDALKRRGCRTTYILKIDTRYHQCSGLRESPSW